MATAPVVAPEGRRRYAASGAVVEADAGPRVDVRQFIDRGVDLL